MENEKNFWHQWNVWKILVLDFNISWTPQKGKVENEREYRFVMNRVKWIG